MAQSKPAPPWTFDGGNFSNRQATSLTAPATTRKQNNKKRDDERTPSSWTPAVNPACVKAFSKCLAESLQACCNKKARTLPYPTGCGVRFFDCSLSLSLSKRSPASPPNVARSSDFPLQQDLDMNEDREIPPNPLRLVVFTKKAKESLYAICLQT